MEIGGIGVDKDMRQRRRKKRTIRGKGVPGGKKVMGGRETNIERKKRKEN